VIIPVIVLERSSPLASFGRSWQLVRGRAWHVFATLVLVFLILLVGAVIVGAIFGRDQVVATYEDGWDRLRTIETTGGLPRAVNFVTGPSRTADIEQHIELGAHGPGRLHIVLVEDVRVARSERDEGHSAPVG